MKNFNIFIFVALVMATQVFPQKNAARLELIHADSSRSYLDSQKNPIRLLEGNVILKQDSLVFYCDRVMFKKSSQSFFFTGNVQIINGKDTIQTDSLWYFRKERKSLAKGNTRIRRPGEKLNCRELLYFFKLKKMKASKDVYLVDAQNNFRAWGNFMTNDRLHHIAIIYENAKIIQNPPDADSLIIYADTLIQLKKQSNRLMEAIKSVKIVQADLVATADSAFFNEQDGMIFLSKKPKVIQKNTEMRGDEISVMLEEKKLHKIIIDKRAEIHSIIDSSKMDEDVIKGRRIFLFFKEDSLHQMKAIQNAEAKYHSTDEEEKGINYITADSIKIYMKHNKVDSIFVHGGTEGTYFPENMTEMAP